MTLWNNWRFSLGASLLGLFLLGGCGGSDVPDPESDANAANEAMPVAPGDPVAPAVAEAPADPGPAPEAPASDAPAPSEPTPAATATSEAPTEEAPTAEATPAPSSSVVKGAVSTSELLALGNKALPEEEPLPSSSVVVQVEGEGGTATAPGMPGGNPNDMAAAAAAPGIEEAAGPEMGEGMGGGGGPSSKRDYRNPFKAVESFLNALKEKNPEELAEATAKRAPHEATGAKNQALFASILDEVLTEDDLNDLANKLQGYTIIGNNTPKSTGQFTVILGKTGENGSTLRRTIRTRREKAGWKVVDISGVGEIKRMGVRRPGRR